MNKPAYKIRLKDLVPFKGANRHARRCGIEKAFAEVFWDLNTEQYDLKAQSRNMLLALYNGVVVGGLIVGTLFGLAKILE